MTPFFAESLDHLDGIAVKRPAKRPPVPRRARNLSQVDQRELRCLTKRLRRQATESPEPVVASLEGNRLPLAALIARAKDAAPLRKPQRQGPARGFQWCGCQV